LAKKGLTKTDADTADLYVGYQAAVGQEKEYTSFDTGWGYGPGYGRGWYGGGGGVTTPTTATTSVRPPPTGTDDPPPQTPDWRAAASKTLDPDAKPEKQQKNLAKAVQKMLKTSPPPAKKTS